MALRLMADTGAGLGCGEPTAAFVREGTPPSVLLTRSFENGKVAVDVMAGAATITCENRKT